MDSDANRDHKRQGERRSAQYYRILLLSVVLVGEFLAGLLFVLGVPFESPYFISLNLGLLTILTVLPVVIRLRTRSLNVAELGLWFSAFYFAHMVLGGLHILVFNGPPLDYLPSDIAFFYLSAGLSVATLGLICFWLGYSLPIGYRITNRLPPFSSTWERHRLPAILLGCLVIAWTARFAIVYLSSGSLNAWLAAPANERFLGVPGITYLKLVGELSALVGFITLSIAYIDRDWRLYLATTAILLPEIGFRLLTGMRRAVPFLVLGLVITVYLLSNRSFQKSLKYGVAGASNILLLVVMYPFVSVYRHTGSLSLTAVATELTSLGLLDSLGHRLIGANTLSFLLYRVPNPVPHFYGKDLLLIPQSVVPRLLWPGKPQTSMGRLYAEIIVVPGSFPAAKAVPPTIPGQLYWSGSFAGLIIGMLTIGVLWRILNNYLVRPQNHVVIAAFVGIMFPSFFYVMEQDLIALFTKHLFRFVLMGSVVLLASADFRGATTRLPVEKSIVLRVGTRLCAVFTNSQLYKSIFRLHDYTVAVGRTMTATWENSLLRMSLQRSKVYSLTQQLRP
ncbi:hypothetical protein [Halorussus pelagicus]|uniref:hypothetical protein n=1 Tax=Halorussus pelagicus TaxID=2505977 RepID=UPI000FFB08B4|nr:hypothetical protein [Halorussus pelagicus]